MKLLTKFRIRINSFLNILNLDKDRLFYIRRDQLNIFKVVLQIARQKIVFYKDVYSE